MRFSFEILSSSRWIKTVSVAFSIPVTGVSNGTAGGAELITCRKWSVHCLGHTNTCNNRKVFTCTWTFSLPPLLSHWVQGVGGSLSGPVPDQ